MFYLVLAVIAVAGVAAIVMSIRGGTTGGAATEPIALDIADTRELYERAAPKRLGAEAAPNRVVVFSDFMCPGCAAFALRERHRIMPYVERGEAQFIAFDFTLGGNFVHSFLASRAARCAGEQPMPGSEDGTAYWPYHDLLYQRQATWSGDPARRPSQREVSDMFVGYARELGLDTRPFEQCLRSDRYADVVTASRMVGDQLGVRGTPTVLVNNRHIGGRTIAEMGDSVLRLLEVATGQEAGGTP
jgi:protein-disulfide isomerase